MGLIYRVYLLNLRIMNQSSWEYTAAALVGTAFLIICIAAILPARAEVRDDLRRQDVTNLKKAAEQYFNLHEYYPTPPAGVSRCTSSSPESWFFGESSSLLRGQHIDAIPHDVRERRGYHYAYCVTSRDGTDKTAGYYLQAQLERPEMEQRSFDEDETRKFHFRILHESDQVLYRVCGGNEKQCEQ